MNVETLLQRHGAPLDPAAPLRAALVGAGEFGAAFVAQARRGGQLHPAVICDLDPDRARNSALAAGYPPDTLHRCPDAASARSAIERGGLALIDDVRLLAELPVAVVVEATGDPEAAALTASTAIAAGQHVVIATKEAEVVVGPILARHAKAQGVVHTLVDGDQPSLLVGLVGWARSLGFEIVCAGKASESDFVGDGTGDGVTAWGETRNAPGFGGAFHLDPSDLAGSLARRARAPFPRTTVPDLCEMGIVANHTGLLPDRPELHAPIARTVELPTLFRPRADGGLLAARGRVDMFNCLRRPDELSFAGGVFVVVEAPDAATGRLLAHKGLPTCPDARYVLLHNPVHLLGAEALMSALVATRLGCSTGGAEPRPVVDLVAVAERGLEPGETLAIGVRHAIAGLGYELRPAAPVRPGQSLPYYLAAGATVRRPVPAGRTLTVEDVDLARDALLYRLRRQQDEAFFPGGGTTA